MRNGWGRQGCLDAGRSLVFRDQKAAKKQRQTQHREPSGAPGLRSVQDRLTRDGSHTALQIAQALDRILDLSRSAFNELAGQIARDQTHAMHPVLLSAYG